ncbi:hypothetical protein [Verrucomicrobium spinosum]|uniref:hypothetical protein n=1 Tax=Verrucomicrobium spinosum TaxID=2736 RepID=UPI001C476AE6|nr:hypothetical protein [Verrucomicrobium spinosum]
MMTELTSNRDIERLIQLDFLRATEVAALNVMKWVGKGNKELPMKRLATPFAGCSTS